MKRVAIFLWGFWFAKAWEFLISHADTLNDENFFVVFVCILTVASAIVAAIVTFAVIIGETWEIFEK